MKTMLTGVPRSSCVSSGITTCHKIIIFKGRILIFYWRLFDSKGRIFI